MPLKLGKLPARHDPRTLKLSRYLKLAELPPLPSFASWSPAVLAAGGYPIYLNNQLGDCAIAGPAHLVQTWTANAGSIVIPTDDQILDAYSAVSGYTITDPNSDVGCNLLDVLNYWRQTGIAGHRIGAYVAIDPKNIRELHYAIALFGGALLGVALPDSVVQGDLLANPWDDSVTDSPNPDNGHCIVASDFIPTGIAVETWGAVKDLSNGFANRYIDEAYAIFSPDFLNGAGEAPSGFDSDQLLADLSAIIAA